jgi:hypothetical protein
MRSVLQSLAAIVVCGTIGGLCGWWLSTWFGLGGVSRAMMSLVVGMVVSVGLFTAGVVLLNNLRKNGRDG